MFSSEFISSWLQRSVARPCTDLPFIAMLPWHDIKKKTSQILMVLNNVDSSVTRSKMFDVVAVVMEEWPGSRDYRVAISALWQTGVAQAFTDL